MDDSVRRVFLNNRLKVLVVGDVILDEYIWGTVERISPEAPVQILECRSENTALGGAANVINNLIALGCTVYAAGIIGKDEKGKILLKQLQELGVKCKGIIEDTTKPTTNKIRVIASSQQILRIDRENKNPISPTGEKMIVQFLKKTIRLVDGVICSDYQKGVLTTTVLQTIFKEAKKSKKIVIIDPKGSDYSKYKGVTIITPNEKELEIATPFVNPDKRDTIRVRATYLMNMLKNKAILVTRGNDGMTLFEGNGGYTDIPTEAKEVYDVTGAGDTVISVFSMCIFSGCDLITSAKLANKAAGIVVGKVGTSVITKEELITAFKEEGIFSRRKIKRLDELKRIVSLAKNQKKRVVFTNGCFDLLHIGHIKYLEEAKRTGDILIIGLNDDDSVKRLKGPERPLINQIQRANVLAALNCIDYVIIFSELTPERLIKELHPDVLVKGGDYSIDEVVGREIVEGYGGEVRLIPIVKDVSTTRIVKDIVERYKKGSHK